MNVTLKLAFGVLGALLGYSLRAYGRWAAPFFEITHISRVGVRSDPVAMDRAVFDTLNSSFYIEGIVGRPGSMGTKIMATSGEVDECWDKIDDVQRYWPLLKSALDELFASRTEQEYLNNLFEILRFRSFDRFFMSAVDAKRISIPQVPQGEGIVEVTYDSSFDRGSYLLFFPNGREIHIGERLAIRPLRREKLESFLARLSGFDPQNADLVRFMNDKCMIFRTNFWRVSRKWL